MKTTEDPEIPDASTACLLPDEQKGEVVAVAEEEPEEMLAIALTLETLETPETASMTDPETENIDAKTASAGEKK